MFRWMKEHKISSAIVILLAGFVIGLGVAVKFNLPPKSDATSDTTSEERIVKSVSGEIEIQSIFIVNYTKN